MKTLLFATILLLSSGETRASLGLKGPEGEGMLFYRENNTVVIQHCSPSFPIGKVLDKAKKSCIGRTTKIPIASFKQAVGHSISTSFLHQFKHTSDTAGLKNEVHRINTFLKASGKSVIKTENLLDALKDKAAYSKALEKIDEDLAETVDEIVSGKKHTFINPGPAECDENGEGPLLYTLLKNFDTYEVPCGQNGPVEEGISACAALENSKKGKFVLVARTPAGKEVWKDTLTNTIWTDGLPKPMSHADAEKACRPGLEEMAGITGIKWRLPSKKEFEDAKKNGITDLKASSDKKIYWSATYKDGAAWVYSGQMGNIYTEDRKYNDIISTRCVAAPSKR